MKAGIANVLKIWHNILSGVSSKVLIFVKL